MGRYRAGDGIELAREGLDFAAELLDGAGQRPQGQPCGGQGRLDRGDPELAAALHQLATRQARKLLSQRLRGGDQQALELIDGPGSRLHRRIPGAFQQPQHLHRAIGCFGLSRGRTCQQGARCHLGIDRVVLSALTAQLMIGSVHLTDAAPCCQQVGDSYACRDLDPWIQAISEGRSRGGLSARTLNRLQVGALQAGKTGLAERYGAVFGEPSFWTLVPLDASTAAMAARLEVQLLLPAPAAEDLACAIASGSLCLLSADPTLISLSSAPVPALPEGLQLVPIGTQRQPP